MMIGSRRVDYYFVKQAKVGAGKYCEERGEQEHTYSVRNNIPFTHQEHVSVYIST